MALRIYAPLRRALPEINPVPPGELVPCKVCGEKPEHDEGGYRGESGWTVFHDCQGKPGMPDVCFGTHEWNRLNGKW